MMSEAQIREWLKVYLDRAQEAASHTDWLLNCERAALLEFVLDLEQAPGYRQPIVRIPYPYEKAVK